ncbi:amidase [Nocardia panacis]|uniref:amidase n=1 Tax=Nocardia panacis TaxID=2340916 RepID=A0A3A4KQN6_9NOCA|nr:amidase [Nocardia panacis]
MDNRLTAFIDDALGRLDAVAMAAAVRDGSTTPEELAAAAAARAQAVDPTLHALAYAIHEQPRYAEGKDGALFGVPTYVKDNTDVRGLPSNHGSAAFRAAPARRDGAYTSQLRSTGLTVLGKTRMPEFGFSPTTEFMTEEPTRNPWHTDYSVGASSGGAAALVAAGVVPIAHANDGGGSIRIPAACAGLVGLKPSRDRHVNGEQSRTMPINLISEGVLTRSVRDTAAYLAAIEDYRRNPALPPIGLVQGPARRRLRVGLILDTITGAPTDDQTRAAVLRTAALLEQAGHLVEPIELPVGRQFADDFLQYWALLADLAASTGRFVFDRTFDIAALDGLTLGLRARHRAAPQRTPGALLRLRGTARACARMFDRHELVLSPVLSHITPELGYLSPTLDFEELRERLIGYVGFTPLNNVAGTPAISLPMGMADTGVPIGVQLAAAYGDERTLLETAYELEAAQPFPLLAEAV